jgi:GH24 family phage-related lysozyme (muramidase)
MQMNTDMERSLKITSDGRLFEMEGDRTIYEIETAGQVDRLIDALQFTPANIFTILPPGEEPPGARGVRQPTRNINSFGLKLIKTFEGLELNAYQDAVGVWTIGYGHTKTAKKGMTISEAQAEELLKADLNLFEVAVADAIKVTLEDNQFSALVSFAFNLGPRNLSRSTLLKLLNSGDIQGAADEFPRWNKAGGQVLLGLTRRRNAERALFLGKPWEPFVNS